jgi:hypothetical protein
MAYIDETICYGLPLPGGQSVNTVKEMLKILSFRPGCCQQQDEGKDGFSHGTRF